MHRMTKHLCLTCHLWLRSTNLPFLILLIHVVQLMVQCQLFWD
uniref:Uncharacterized protein n=1 Tax=Arundo donax TaxID=35708 RepID=A0A0A8Z8P8_ARUDO